MDEPHHVGIVERVDPVTTVRNDAHETRVAQDAIVWTPEAVGLLAVLGGLSLLVLAATAWHHARKPAFY